MDRCAWLAIMLLLELWSMAVAKLLMGIIQQMDQSMPYRAMAIV